MQDFLRVPGKANADSEGTGTAFQGRRTILPSVVTRALCPAVFLIVKKAKAIPLMKETGSQPQSNVRRRCENRGRFFEGTAEKRRTSTFVCASSWIALPAWGQSERASVAETRLSKRGGIPKTAPLV